MFRKAMFALTALTILGAAALAPTAASAKGGWHHHHGWGSSLYISGPAYAYADYGCWTKRWVDTPFGPRLKRFYVCY